MGGAWNLFKFTGFNEDGVIKFWVGCKFRTVDISKTPRALWNQGPGIAAKRAGALSEEAPSAFSLGAALHKAMPRLILTKVKPTGPKAP